MKKNKSTIILILVFFVGLSVMLYPCLLYTSGISMTAQYQCGEEEHTHTADCYTKVLTCGYEEGELENADELAAACLLYTSYHRLPARASFPVK